jgi:tryptophanyl-tRNA synthetase
MKKLMLTGARPTGLLHLGHYLGAFEQYLKHIEGYDTYFIVSDCHMMTTKCSKKDILSIHENAKNMVTDLIGAGLDPQSTTFYLQSNIPELSNIYVLIQNLVSVDRIKDTPSLKEMARHSENGIVSLGLLAYPVMEAADVISLEADLVPVGRDNIDHIEVTREIITKINSEYGADFKLPEWITGNNNYLLGTDGNEKMSKSLNNAIFLRDSDNDINTKINNMKWITGEGAIKNPVIEYLKAFDKDENAVENLINRYSKNEIIEREAKERLKQVLFDLIRPMRERRKQYEENPEEVDRMLKEGTIIVREKAIKSLEKLRKAMGLFSYFR